MNFGKCRQIVTHQRIVFEENRSKITFLNPSKQKVQKVKVDGCLPIDGIKCDFLLISEKKVEYFVELKGSDVDHAANQLCATIENISAAPKTQPKHSFVISTRCPLTSPQIQVLQKKFKREYNSTFRIKNLQSEQDL